MTITCYNSVERGVAKAEDEIDAMSDALANRDRELEDSRIRSVQATQKLQTIRAALGVDDPSPEVPTEQLVGEMSRELAELKEKILNGLYLSQCQLPHLVLLQVKNT